MYIQSRIKQAEFRGFTREDGYLCARMCVHTNAHTQISNLIATKYFEGVNFEILK